MPARRDLDPTEFSPRLLPHLRITEFLEGCTRFRYRLVGTAVVEAYGAEITWQYIDELYVGEQKLNIEARYRLICEKKRPMFLRSRFITVKGFDILANRLLAPLSSDGVGVDMVIVALTFEYGSADPAAIRGASLDVRAEHLEML